MKLTLSVRSFQTPPTPATSAWPPSLPSVPTSRATRVTSLAKAFSWSTMTLTVFLSSRISPWTSPLIFLERSPMATAGVTSAMLRTAPVRLPAIKLTLSVRSSQTPPTPLTCAWPPSLPSVPTSRATRVTSEVNRLSWWTIVFTVFAVSRNWPWRRLPSISIGIVCDRSPRATAPMTRAISLFGRSRSSMRSLTDSSVVAQAPPASPSAARLIWPSLPTRLPSLCSTRSNCWLDSMTSLSAEATLPADPVQLAGRRAVKSPRLTAVKTLIMTLGSMVSAAAFLVPISADSSLFCDLSRGRYPEFQPRSSSGITLDSEPTATQVDSLGRGNQTDVTRLVQSLGEHEPGAIVDDLDANAGVPGFTGNPDARGVGVFLDVGDGFGERLENDRPGCSGYNLRELDINVWFDTGVGAQELQPFVDGLRQPKGRVQ